MGTKKGVTVAPPGDVDVPGMDAELAKRFLDGMQSIVEGVEHTSKHIYQMIEVGQMAGGNDKSNKALGGMGNHLMEALTPAVVGIAKVTMVIADLKNDHSPEAEAMRKGANAIIQAHEMLSVLEGAPPGFLGAGGKIAEA